MTVERIPMLAQPDRRRRGVADARARRREGAVVRRASTRPDPGDHPERSDAPAADPDEPRRQRHQVHRDGRRPHRRALRRRATPPSPRLVVRGGRHRHRHVRAEQIAQALPAVRPGRRLDHAPLRRHGPRAGHQPAAGRAARRRRSPSRASPGGGSSFTLSPSRRARSQRADDRQASPRPAAPQRSSRRVAPRPSCRARLPRPAGRGRPRQPACSSPRTCARPAPRSTIAENGRLAVDEALGRRGGRRALRRHPHGHADARARRLRRDLAAPARGYDGPIVALTAHAMAATASAACRRAATTT